MQPPKLTTMKKVAFLFSCLLIFSFQVNAQNKEIRAATYMKRFDEKTIDRLKATTTVFFYSKQMEPQLDSLKQAISDGWKMTPLIFDNINHFEKYAVDPKYSYFVIEGITIRHSSGTESIYYYLNLRMFESVSKKGKIETTGLCRIELYPDLSTLAIGFGGIRSPESVVEALYRKGAFYNFSPVLLRAQLATVETDLSNRLKPFAFYETLDDNFSTLIAKDTLYVPKRLLMYFNGLTGKERVKEENVFEGYPFKFRICTDEELFQVFQTEKRGRLIFEYVKSSANKFVTVYDLKQKKVVYRRSTPMSYNLKQKDIEKMASR